MLVLGSVIKGLSLNNASIASGGGKMATKTPDATRVPSAYVPLKSLHVLDDQINPAANRPQFG